MRIARATLPAGSSPRIVKGTDLEALAHGPRPVGSDACNAECGQNDNGSHGSATSPGVDVTFSEGDKRPKNQLSAFPTPATAGVAVIGLSSRAKRQKKNSTREEVRYHRGRSAPKAKVLQAVLKTKRHMVAQANNRDRQELDQPQLCKLGRRWLRSVK